MRITLPTELLRAARAAGLDLAQYGYTRATDEDDSAAPGQTVMYSTTAATHATRNLVHAGESVQATLEAIRAQQNGVKRTDQVMTGIPGLDWLTGGGLRAQQLIVIAGPRTIPKFSLALDFARHAAIAQGQTTALFSLETSQSEITTRVLAAEASIPLPEMRHKKPNLSDEEWIRLTRHLDALESVPLLIDDSSYLSVAKLRSKALRLQQQRGLSLVIVDYLQLLRHAQRTDQHHQDVALTHRSLKHLAKELDVPLVVVSQINRNLKRRKGDRPMLSDLRESGTLEQDADMVLMLHRDAAYDPQGFQAGEVDLILEKHRNGPVGVVPLLYQDDYSRFIQLPTEHASEGR
jgi:replicative DNA helicase